MPRIVECAACGGRFEGKRPTAKYCSPRCRTRASRATKGESVPPRRDAAIVVGLPPREVDLEDGFAAQTRRELEAAGRLDGYLGRSAMYLAGILDASPGDTGGGHAALIRQYIASMAAALDGANVQETAVESLRRRAQGRVGAA